ncbi:MAG: VWA domain-containing protein [Thermoanaerobaculia bacterium]
MHRIPSPRKTALTGLALLATCLLPWTPAVAQEAGFTGEVQVTEVLLDVVVTDRDGNVILGLGPDDFIVEDGEEPVELTDVTFYSNRRFVESANIAQRLGVSPDEVPVDRYFILFFDDPRQVYPDLTNQLLDSLRWARRWVHQELLPNDYVAVVSYDVKLKLHQDFTTDNEAILRALDGVARGKDPGGNWPSRTELSTGPSLRKNLVQGEELSKATRKIYGAMETLAEAAGYIIGRKNLLLFSVGFGDAGEFGLNPAAVSNLETGNFGTYQADERYYPHMMQELNDNNVAVYSVSYLENLADESPDQALLNNGLSLVASDTGGEYYANFANFRFPLRQVVEDNNGYYLLAYKARVPEGDDYREVEVQTKNPDFVVRARKGYLTGS